jgi:hypothetical protein
VVGHLQLVGVTHLVEPMNLAGLIDLVEQFGVADHKDSCSDGRLVAFVEPFRWADYRGFDVDLGEGVCLVRPKKLAGCIGVA